MRNFEQATHFHFRRGLFTFSEILRETNYVPKDVRFLKNGENKNKYMVNFIKNINKNLEGKKKSNNWTNNNRFCKTFFVEVDKDWITY